MYALSVWKGFVSVEQTNRINALLKRCYRYGYVDKIHCLSDLLNSVGFFDKMQSKAHCLYPLLPQSEVNLNMYVVRGMTLFYHHVPKIFTRDLSSCVVCLVLCNNSILLYCLIVLSYYRLILDLQVPLCFSLFLYVIFLYHICVCHVSINITYLLTYPAVHSQWSSFAGLT